jgi:hypothetical protein
MSQNGMRSKPPDPVSWLTLPQCCPASRKSLPAVACLQRLLCSCIEARLQIAGEVQITYRSVNPWGQHGSKGVATTDEPGAAPFPFSPPVTKEKRSTRER